MSMTAEERAKMLMRALNDDGCDDPDCCYHGRLYNHLIASLRAHANAALERAAKVADNYEITGVDGEGEGSSACLGIAAAVRALRDKAC